MLEWQLTNAEKLKRLDQFEKMKERGQPVPFLDNVPEIDPHHLWLWEGFIVLTTQRWSGHEGALQPIPVSEIKAYAEYVGMADEADREDFLWVILKLDELVLNHMQNKREKAREKQIKEAKKQQAQRPRGRRR